ncbi:MAG: hypothetical protein IPK73_24920 [Candidatus Obscuribacter sp.]|nr:hypothetical protein [Candidatus Obscuribacter sp.]MBK9277360.1 hypothetical protein [Candidatus Obscuribacter sp.]
MKKRSLEQIAQEAALFMACGEENEYLQAKERALMMLGVNGQGRMPSNRKIKACIAKLTLTELGKEETDRRLREMRSIALNIMLLIDNCDPHLIGSVLTGEIRTSSDIDLHAYSDCHEEIVDILSDFGYEDTEVELVENRKGSFVHIKWLEQGYPVEITVYPWSWRHIVLNSSVTGKPMKRADTSTLQKLLQVS